MSIASSSCRIDWRPSRRLCLALVGLGLLGAASVLLSDLPAWSRAMLAPGALAYGLWLARREWRRTPFALEIDADGVVLMLRDASRHTLAAPRLRLRGSLASLEGRVNGRRESLVWCADTLPTGTRRQLFLRIGGRTPA